LVNFLSIKGREILFNFNDLGCADILFGNLYVQFQELFGNIDQFDVFEIFGDLINLLLQFGGDWRWSFLDTHWSRLIDRFVASVGWS